MRLPVEQLITAHKDSIFSVAYNICKNPQDAEDVVQETFLRYFRSEKEFDNAEHVRAWLIRVAVNLAKDTVRSFWHRNRMPLSEQMEQMTFETEDARLLFAAVMDLPERYRIVLHLFYYEAYTIREISSLLGIRENTIKSRLARGRKLLKNELSEVWNENE